MLAGTLSPQTRIVPCAGRVSQVKHVTFNSNFIHSRPVATKALPDVSYILDIAEGAPGTVDAPLPVVAGLAIVISAAALLFFSLGLKPGKRRMQYKCKEYVHLLIITLASFLIYRC